ncbi:MAG: hypothetical protein MJ247_03640 [Alphaproteobacteria bacterium]|nr:hypothetical protein [Alphaproteobacteria bacterium]
MKKIIFLCLFALCGCGTLYNGERVASLDVEFDETTPSSWGSRNIPSTQVCRRDGGRGATPGLLVSNIPVKANLLLLSMNDDDNPDLANGGLGVLGFPIISGQTEKLLMPVMGEENRLPKFVFAEKRTIANVNEYPYMPPCRALKHHYSASVIAVYRTGSFDKQKTEVLGYGKIYLGKY